MISITGIISHNFIYFYILLLYNLYKGRYGSMYKDDVIELIDDIIRISEYIDYGKSMSKKDYKKRIKYLKKVKKKIKDGDIDVFSE